jgi:hypothetical protein
VLAAEIGDDRPRLLLSQHPDDLLFGEPAPLHIRSLFCGPDSSCPWRRNKGSRQDVERAAETVRVLFQIAMIKLMIRRIARSRDF